MKEITIQSEVLTNGIRVWMNVLPAETAFTKGSFYRYDDPEYIHIALEHKAEVKSGESIGSLTRKVAMMESERGIKALKTWLLVAYNACPIGTCKMSPKVTEYYYSLPLNSGIDYTYALFSVAEELGKFEIVVNK